MQSATRKLFSNGTVWLDTTVLLPFFAEDLTEEPSQRKFSQTFDACTRAGIELRVTSGIVQEIVSHMDLALTCESSRTWQGRTPFLYEQFLMEGEQGSLREWLERFRGYQRPEDDLVQYLRETLGVERADLRKDAESVDTELRAAVEYEWSDAHEKRRQSDHMDEATKQRLIRHDIETYLGVIRLRQSEDVSELGYRHWLLTLDRIAWHIRDRLRTQFRKQAPQSPLLSLSFLQNNLTFGPSRYSSRDSSPSSVPFLLDIEMTESMPHDILNIADKVRKQHEGLPEFLVKRRVRDAIDTARRRGYIEQL